MIAPPRKKTYTFSPSVLSIQAKAISLKTLKKLVFEMLSFLGLTVPDASETRSDAKVETLTGRHNRQTRARGQIHQNISFPQPSPKLNWGWTPF